MKKSIKISFLVMLLMVFCIDTYSQVEIKEYQGEKLSPFDRSYDNSIKGPQKVDINKYRLIVNGKIQKSLLLTYTQILALPSVTRAITNQEPRSRAPGYEVILLEHVTNFV